MAGEAYGWLKTEPRVGHGISEGAFPAQTKSVDPTAVQILVRLKSDAPSGAADAVHVKAGARLLRTYGAPSGLHLVQVARPGAVGRALTAYRKNPYVLYAEPDAVIRPLAIPNDTSFSDQWALDNTVQTGGTADADMNGPEAWEVTSGSQDVVVAFLDSGIDYSHEDLADNMWVNLGEIAGNGIDDDGNGYVDDLCGINISSSGSAQGDPMDDFGHGTRMVGLAAARGNNGVGLSGVAWHAQLIACKFIDNLGQGSMSGAIACLDYVYALKTRTPDPVNIVATSNSWGGLWYIQAVRDAIAAQIDAGILFVGGAGNYAADNDDPTAWGYPASFFLPNIISVAATDHDDSLWTLSSFGRRTVHIGAPGVGVSTTSPGNLYMDSTGTSAAAPFVTGLVILLEAQDPSRDWIALRNLVLAGGQDRPATSGTTISKKRVRAWDTDGVGSLSCADQVVRARLRPSRDTVFAARGQTALGLAALHIDCAAPNGELDISVDPPGTLLTLADDGLGFDRVAADGIYAAQWDVPGVSGIAQYSLGFPAADVVDVQIMDRYRPAESTPYDWRNIGGTDLGLGDEQVAAVTAPFGIRFGNAQSLDTLIVSSNGVIRFTDNHPWPDNEALPTVRFEIGIAVLWDDLDPSAAGQVIWEVIGNTPDRELVVEWRGVPFFGAPTETVTFQAVFFEDSSDILCQYADATVVDSAYNNGQSATVGIQVASDAATEWSFDTPGLSDNLALVWRANRPPTASAGSDRVVSENTVVTLDGMTSFDPDGDSTIAAFHWTQVAGGSVILIGADTATPSFTTLCVAETLTFELTVVDDFGAIHADRVDLSVVPNDTDSDGIRDCDDGCPSDPDKTDPGICGCGIPDIGNCDDGCPGDPDKTDPGICGCGTPDTDTDSDGSPDCNDGCPVDPLNDGDGDGICDGADNCPSEANPDQTDSDEDGLGDACVSQTDDPIGGGCSCHAETETTGFEAWPTIWVALGWAIGRWRRRGSLLHPGKV